MAAQEAAAAATVTPSHYFFNCPYFSHRPSMSALLPHSLMSSHLPTPSPTAVLFSMTLFFVEFFPAINSPWWTIIPPHWSHGQQPHVFTRGEGSQRPVMPKWSDLLMDPIRNLKGTPMGQLLGGGGVAANFSWDPVQAGSNYKEQFTCLYF